MQTTHQEATIKIDRTNGKGVFISAFMPIWNRTSEHGHLQVSLPLIGFNTVANNEEDAEVAVREALLSFCTIAERFGQGIEKELQALGWTPVNNHGEPLMGFSIEDADSAIERILQTGESFTVDHLEVA